MAAESSEGCQAGERACGPTCSPPQLLVGARRLRRAAEGHDRRRESRRSRSPCGDSPCDGHRRVAGGLLVAVEGGAAVTEEPGFGGRSRGVGVTDTGAFRGE